MLSRLINSVLTLLTNCLRVFTLYGGIPVISSYKIMPIDHKSVLELYSGMRKFSKDEKAILEIEKKEKEIGTLFQYFFHTLLPKVSTAGFLLRIQ